MANIEIEGLSKTYGKRVGVKNISLKIADKEFVAIFGPAGAGKTTTLNLIAGIVTPDGGNVRIADKDIGGLEPAERNVAMVFESYALYPQLTVYENMAFPLQSPKFKLPDAEVDERVKHYAKVMKIDHLIQRPIQALSNGQRQRTALGRALVRKPNVFLMDEPLSHLDAKLRHSMRAELKEMRQQLGTTTIYVTHDYLEAMSLGDRIVILDEGSILQVGTPDEVYFRPASTRVAALFGDPEVNLVEGRVVAGPAGQLSVELFGGQYKVPLLSAELSRALASHNGNGSREQRFKVGFRPADVAVDHRFGDQAAGADAAGSVYSFEPLGTKCVVTATATDGTRVRALVPGRKVYRADEQIRFSVQPENLIFFDAETGNYITRSMPVEEDEHNG